MRKIASPTELQAELRSIMAFVQGHGPNGKPDRQLIAAKIRELADRVAAHKVEKQRSGYANTTIWLVKDPSQKEEGSFGQTDKIVGYVLHAKPGKDRGGYTRPEPYTAFVGEPDPGTLGRRYVYREGEKLERSKEVGSFYDEAEIKKLEAAGKLMDGDKLIQQVGQRGGLGGLDAALKAIH